MAGNCRERGRCDSVDLTGLGRGTVRWQDVVETVSKVIVGLIVLGSMGIGLVFWLLEKIRGRKEE